MTPSSFARVTVLMSTYQGEAFISQQVDSILSQLPSSGRLVVRDDGSTDQTVRILQSIKDPRLEISAGSNLGFGQSFLSLLAGAAPESQIVMLSDQDDVWLPGKIERACAALEGQDDTPTLYFSRLHLVDRELRPLGETPRWPRGPSFANALCQNIATGCTMALNMAAVRLVTRGAGDSRIYFHDWWIYLVVSALGKVIMDDEPTILYRQHGENVIGRGLGWQRYRAALAFIRKRSWIHILFNQLDALREAHGEALSPTQRQMLDLYFDPRRVQSVLRLLLLPIGRLQFPIEELTFRGLLLAELAVGRGLLPRAPDKRP